MSDRITKSIKNNIWVKVGLIFLISLILMIPTTQIKGVINERHEFGESVKKEVADKWSKSQVAGAIVLSIPVIQKIKTFNDNGKAVMSDDHTMMHFFPEELKIKSITKSLVRYRGVYKVPLYESKLTFSGKFSDINSNNFELNKEKTLWDKALLSMGIKDVRGLKSVEVNWNGEKISEEMGEMPSDLLENSINASLVSSHKELKETGKGDFFIEITLRGSEALEFYPSGKTTEVEMTSDWGAPSFMGAYLPESHEIENEKFNASWKILGLTRNLPKKWIGNKSLVSEIESSRFGVNLHMPLQSYQLNTRSVKYSLLFILLTFITMFFIEVICKIRFHPMHYGMVGASLVLFYLLLLSFSEHIGFSGAYCIAAVTTVLTISMYVFGVTKVKKSTLIVLSQLSLIYGFLFILLQQEDYTLVFGVSGLWIILALLMYITRKIDWFDLNLAESKK